MSPKGYASIGTTLVVALAIALMMCSHLNLTSATAEAADKGEFIIDDEMYIDVLDAEMAPDMPGDTPAAAFSEEQAPSLPTPASGTDLADSGSPGVAPVQVTQSQPSPQTQSKPDKPAGPSAEELRKQEEQRQAANEVTNAFSHATGQHNTVNGNGDTGNAGDPNSQSQQGSYTGNGTGSVGGGWGMPQYGKVRSTVTGSVKMKATIDRNGNVTNVEFIGGDAPAATNSAARKACMIEVKSRKFTRPNSDDAPESATAYITYTFK